MASTISQVVISAAITCAISGVANGLVGAASTSVTKNPDVKPLIGGSAGLVNKVYSASMALSTSATTLDLTTLTDPLGASITFSKVRAIFIINQSVTAGENVTVGGGTNPIFAAEPDTLKGGGGDAELLKNYGSGTEQTVDSTHKNLALTSAAGTPTVVVVVVGY